LLFSGSWFISRKFLALKNYFDNSHITGLLLSVNNQYQDLNIA